MANYIPSGLLVSALRELTNHIAAQTQGTDKPWVIQVPQEVLDWMYGHLSDANTITSVYVRAQLQAPHAQEVRKEGGGQATVQMGEIFDI